MTRRRLALGLALGAVGLVSAAAPTVLAYNLMGPKWPNPSAPFDVHSLPSSWRPMATFGAQQWTDVPTSSFVYTSNNDSNNDITRGGIDGKYGTLAITYVYYQGGNIVRMTMKFDTAEPWYLGTGSPGGSQVDARSVSVHEFGHGLGLAHTQSGNCPNNSSRATMCSSYILGTSYQRSLEADDQNGVSYLYP